MSTDHLTPTTIKDAIKKAVKVGRPLKRYDGLGLYLLIDPKAESALWRLRYKLAGREKLISLGRWPDVDIATAREKRTTERRLLANGVDPSAARKVTQAAAADTFESVAREWLAKRQDNWVLSYRSKVIALLANDVFKFIGSEPVATLTPPDVLAVLRRIEGRGAEDTAHRALQFCSKVFRYAIATSRATSDPTRDLRGALAVPKGGHFAAITEPRRVGELLRALDAHTGQPSVSYALRLLPYVFVRPGELRWAEWSEIDLDAAEWRIPAGRMKMRAPHIVPLARQVVELLRELRLVNTGRLVFPGLRSAARPISDVALVAALRRLGFAQDEMCAHGFRSLASTLLNEKLEADPDAIELQLAHRGSGVRAVYNRGARLEQRKLMMQKWADYLDGLRADKGTGGRNNVVPMRGRVRA